MKRFAYLWLPLFATDRLTRPGKALAEAREAPLATTTRAAGGIRIAAANAAALNAGVAPGLPAADAQAICPGLRTVPATPEADAAALGLLAEWCQRWSPSTAPEGHEGIWIDTTGCDHLFGGESSMLDDMVGRLAALGFAVRAGLADTPGAAWAMARFGDAPAAICPEGAARQWLSSFPVAALRLPAAVAETLRKLGVRRIGELMALPRAPLVARFGAIAAQRLDQMLGRVPEPLAMRPPTEAVSARLAFAEPIGRTEDVAAAIRGLLDRVCARLEDAGLGARRLQLRTFRVDGGVLAQTVGTNEPVRDPVHLMRLFAEGLDGLDAGFGIEVMTLIVTAADPFAARQRSLDARPEGAALALLVDRLARRLGPDRVWRAAPFPSAQPERRVSRAQPLAPAEDFPSAPPRPLRLPRPRPILVQEVDGVPVRVGTVAVAAAVGPERIAGEWWLTDPADAGHRDYWRVEDGDGRRWWVFRRHTRDWFLHGTFG